MPETPPSGCNNHQKFNNNSVKEDIFNTMNTRDSMIKKEKICNLINTLAKIYNERHSEKIAESMINQIVEDLSGFDTETIMDSLILRIVKRIDTWVFTRDEILSNVKLLLEIDPENFKNTEDLINRYNYLKTIWLDTVKITKNCSEILKENHKNVVEVFDNFNKLIENLTKEWLDYYYTWWLVGYLWTNINLQRYHGDIDIYLNVDDLEKLKIFIQKNWNSWFKFIDNIKNKWKHWHEYMIQYWNNPILIGLFLFKKSEEGKISRIEYDFDWNWEVIATESQMKNIEIEDWEFKNTKYKRQSLKSLYDSKKDSSRLKDKYDIRILENYFSNK